MRKLRWCFGIVIILSLFLINCKISDNGTHLFLRKIEEISADEIDTIQSLADKRLYLINIIRNKSFGDFSTTLAIIKNTNKKNLIYEFDFDDRFNVRVSNEFIAYVKEKGKSNWGWFYIEGGKLKNNLPGTSRILDSLRRKRSDCFIRETNGYFSVYKKGELIERVNYGNLIGDKNVNYDNLKFQLYKYNGNELMPISTNVDDVFRQDEGLYFIPLPGYGIVAKYSKSNIFKLIDSAALLKESPETIKVLQH